MKQEYRVLGLMSGTSLDGLDIALCVFKYDDNVWQYLIEKAKTFDYSALWKDKLSSAENLSGVELMLLHNEYGELLGKYVLDFASMDIGNVDFISSHGHTVFHQPHKKLTLQIGNGASISAITRKTVVCDFRTLDVALGGQGAPLVPIGDMMLFKKYSYCLNLGGFANISFNNESGIRVAFDICPVNIVLNHLVKSINLEYDDKGNIGRQGRVNNDLLTKLNNLNFYIQKGPKSLGKEWVWNEVIPILEENYEMPLEDKVCTFYHHTLQQIKNVVINDSEKEMLVTGGGAHNDFLIELFHQNLSPKVIIPDSNIVNFKEALVFAFLGVLRTRGEVNCLKAVTGAELDNIGGTIYTV